MSELAPDSRGGALVYRLPGVPDQRRVTQAELVTSGTTGSTMRGIVPTSAPHPKVNPVRLMRAFTIRSFGAAPAIHELPIPTADREFLIRVTYAAVNPLGSMLVDRLTATSAYPFVMGIDFAGVVEREPTGQHDLHTGDRQGYDRENRQQVPATGPMPAALDRLVDLAEAPEPCRRTAQLAATHRESQRMRHLAQQITQPLAARLGRPGVR
jgi:hypothetical protein